MLALNSPLARSTRRCAVSHIPQWRLDGAPPSEGGDGEEDVSAAARDGRCRLFLTEANATLDLSEVLWLDDTKLSYFFPRPPPPPPPRADARAVADTLPAAERPAAAAEVVATGWWRRRPVVTAAAAAEAAATRRRRRRWWRTRRTSPTPSLV